ncbi:MAG: hypothetical protein PF503_00105, partial [Desulfobacula sp.]|nr:hypothetical protein [Desulfobacula sp.]
VKQNTKILEYFYQITYVDFWYEKLTSQIPQFTERFFHQSGLFEYFRNTTSGIDKFFIPRFKNKLYGKKKNQIEHGSIKAYWRVRGSWTRPRKLFPIGKSAAKTALPSNRSTLRARMRKLDIRKP